ncbi:DUF1993 family protein [Sphingomonas sp. 1P08PE]
MRVVSAAAASASGVSEQDLLGARLAPHMLPLTEQVQNACDTAKLAVTCVAQIEPLPMADQETSITELRDRIARTIAYLEKAEPAAFAGREAAEVILKLPNTQMTFTGQSLITDFQPLGLLLPRNNRLRAAAAERRRDRQDGLSRRRSGEGRRRHQTGRIDRARIAVTVALIKQAAT